MDCEMGLSPEEKKISLHETEQHFHSKWGHSLLV